MLIIYKKQYEIENMKLFLCTRFPMSDYLDTSLINTQPILLTIDSTKQLLHCFSSTDVDTTTIGGLWGKIDFFQNY